MATIYGPANPKTGTISNNYGPANPATGSIGGVANKPSQGVLGASTGGSSGGQSSQQSSQAINGAPQIPQPQQPSVDFDALIAPALQGLEAAIGPLQQGYTDNVSSINSSRDTQLAANNQSIAGQQNTLGQAATTQKSQAQNAQDQARQQYAEIQQGLQSRYGGTTGTGAFASELAGRQTLQNMGQTHQQLSDALLQIDQKKQQVEEVGRIAQQDIENKTRDALAQAKNQLDSSIADIRRQQGDLQSRKAELAANAIQIYQSQVNQVNQQNAAFKQQLYVSQLQATQQLEAARQSGSQQISSFTSSIPGINAAQQTTPVSGSQPIAQANTGGGNLGTSAQQEALKKQLISNYAI